MKHVLFSALTIALSACMSEIPNDANTDSPSPPVVSQAIDADWFIAVGSDCMRQDSTPEQAARQVGGISRTQTRSGSVTFTYPVQAIFINDRIQTIWVQGATNCESFRRSVF